MWKKITKTSFTTASSVSIDGCFSAQYTHYLVVRNLLGSSAGNLIQVRLRVGGADASGADYRRQVVYADSTTVAGARATGDTSWTGSLGLTEATAIGFAQLRISNPFDTVRTTAWASHGYTYTGNIGIESLVYAHDLTTSYDGITVIPAAGTITGTIRVYGLKAS